MLIGKESFSSVPMFFNLLFLVAFYSVLLSSVDILLSCFWMTRLLMMEIVRALWICSAKLWLNSIIFWAH